MSGLRELALLDTSTARHLDTSTVVLLGRLNADDRPAESFISASTLAELSAALRASGRKPGAREYDALIAATAIANRLPLFTCNPTDSTKIPDLDLVALPHPDNPKPARGGLPRHRVLDSDILLRAGQ